MSYPQNLNSGRFIDQGMNSYDLVKAWITGKLNNQDRKFGRTYGFANWTDSLSILTSLKDSIFLKENGFNENNVFGRMYSNTYEIYWNTSADKFRDKMIKEYRKFWNKERVTKLRNKA
jgi:UPF0755 protein